jgi:S1-C subfamily serine protease
VTRRPRSAALLVLALCLLPAAAGADDQRALRDHLHAASVVLGGGSCSGVLAESSDLVFTARHCVRGREAIEVRFVDGTTRQGTVAWTDDVADQAVLVLDAPVDFAPLALARRWPIPGDVLLFEGLPSKPRPQEARLERLDVCPSLPRLTRALFTSVQGTPGDSGAPLVDRAGRVVGLVHGGAQCEIATPVVEMARRLDR